MKLLKWLGKILLKIVLGIAAVLVVIAVIGLIAGYTPAQIVNWIMLAVHWIINFVVGLCNGFKGL